MTKRCDHCGEPFTPTRRARFCSSACRSAAWKARSGYRDPRAPRKASRNASARRQRKPDLRISYRKALDHLEDWLASVGHPTPRTSARQLLHPLLSERQRKHLKGDA